MAKDKLLAEWFWIDRWMGSSAFLLPLEARGLYREMLTQAWRRGAQLPNNHDAIRRAVGVTQEEWEKNWPLISGYFREKNGIIFNPTQVDIYRKAQAMKQKRSKSGRLGGLKNHRLKPEAKVEAKVEAKTEAKAEAKDGAKTKPPSPSPSPSPSLSLSLIENPPLKNAGDFPRTPARGLTGGVMAGSLPRDHINCRQPCVRVCVSERQHAVLCARYGGDLDAASGALDRFYREVRQRLDPNMPIGGKAWDFWESQFTAKFGEALATTGKTAGNMAAAERFIARGKA